MTKKVVVPKQTFQDMDIYNPSYQIRYRIVSDDRNRLSAWTPIYSIDPEVIFICGTFSIPGTIKLQKHSGYVNIAWDSVSIYKDNDSSLKEVAKLPYYDLWIRWSDTGGATPSNWIYKERISSTSLNIVIPATYPNPNPPYNNIAPKNLYVEVYRPGRPILRYQEVRNIVQNSTTVNVSSDVINFFNGHPYTTGAAITYNSSTPITGLSNGGLYYARAINYNQISLHSTAAGAVANTGKVALSGTPSGEATLTSYPFKMYEGSELTL